MSGRSSVEKTASMTTPLISSMRPASDFVLASKCSPLGEALGPSDDFHDFLGDLGLALPVHLERQIVDHLDRVLLCVAHGGHARAVLRGGRFEKGPVDADLDVVGDQPFKNLLRLGMVEP